MATRQQKKVVLGSSLGTVFEWYDFYLYGALAPIIARQFFSGLDAGAAFIFALLAFAAGFVVRPFGALIFGYLGDMIGRKYTFLVTILVMGLSTFIVGILPNQDAIGVAAPVLLIGLRLLQGLALGGEYGGAAIYVAEHAPFGRRGEYTAWIQTTATLGLLLSLVVIIGTRSMLGEDAFADWGWRIPFLGSIVLLFISVWIRLSMQESPAFRRIKNEGTASSAPVRESFTQWKNLRIVLIALFGLTAGQAVVWYTGQFYTLFFLTQALKVDPATAGILVATSLLIGAPFFLLFGWLSDRIGRKPIIMAGCLFAAIGYFPLFGALTAAANPDLARALDEVPVAIRVDASRCSFQGNPIARETDYRSSCDIAKRTLAQAGINYSVVSSAPGSDTIVKVGELELIAPDGRIDAERSHDFDIESRAAINLFRAELAEATHGAGYPIAADPDKMNRPLVIAILSLLVIFVTMVYGPIAALLAELFPTRIRYTSVSVPYHLGNGWFGGLLPAVAFGMVAQSGDIYQGLWYPVIVAAATFVVGMLLVPETRDVDLERIR
ncbi:MFS transporter [Piscinibacter sakaiensis]|uniref:MFS transporter n=1 Tax=Piscinibacter sakaiensis TaxID=1547922 RepID=UPI003AB0E1CC